MVKCTIGTEWSGTVPCPRPTSKKHKTKKTQSFQRLQKPIFWFFPLVQVLFAQFFCHGSISIKRPCTSRNRLNYFTQRSRMTRTCVSTYLEAAQSKDHFTEFCFLLLLWALSSKNPDCTKKLLSTTQTRT